MKSAVGRLFAVVALVVCLVAMPASAVFAKGGPGPHDHPLGAEPPIVSVIQCPPVCIPDLGPPISLERTLLEEMLAFARREFETLLHHP